MHQGLSAAKFNMKHLRPPLAELRATTKQQQHIIHKRLRAIQILFYRFQCQFGEIAVPSKNSA